MHAKYFDLMESITSLPVNVNEESNQEIQLSGTKEEKMFLDYLDDNEDDFIRYIYEEGFEILDDKSIIVILTPEDTYIRITRR